MVFISQYFNNPEIIFPEIAAIAVGSLVSPKLSWNVNKWRVFLCIVICAVGGVLIVRFIPAPIWLQMIIGYFLAQLVFIFSRTTFAPMISAMVLPIMLQTSTVVYIFSAIGFTALIIVIRYILEKCGIVSKENYIKLLSPKSVDYTKVIVRSIIVLPITFCMLQFDWKFAVAPPLLVAFIEFSNSNKTSKFLFKAAALITSASFLGTMCRYVLTVKLEIPLFISAVMGMILVILLMNIVKLYIPPAGAVTILAMLIPEKYLLIYPLEILLGITLLAIISKFCFKFIFAKLSVKKASTI